MGGTSPPMATALSRARPLLLLLLIFAWTDTGQCQRTIGIIQDRSSCQLTPLGWNTTITTGTEIRATCDRQCTSDAVERNQNPFDRSVRGTYVYSLDSDLCLAAIHDARLAYPSQWSQESARVRLRVLQHQGPFVPSFRRGIITPRPERLSSEERLGVEFTSNKVSEPVPEIAVVFDTFRFREGDPLQTVQCHVPMSVNSSDFQLFRLTGSVIRSKEKRKHENESQSSFREARVTSGNRVLCSLQDKLYSDVTAFSYIENPYHAPTRLTYRASRGDGIHIRVDSTVTSNIVWYKDGSPTQRITQKSRSPDSYMIENAEPADSGVYEARNKGYDNGRSSFSVIVRGCPAGRFGPDCRERCPYCLHGGQCHDVTGQCVCPPGFYGDRCQISCDRGRFGDNCSSLCFGSDGGCSKQLLCVPEPYGCGCAAGYKDTFCSKPCDRGTYGPDCNSRCGRCREGSSCDGASGKCESGCEDGFEPPLCLDLPPWFRDPPALVNVGFTDLSITHALWREDYDNGYGTGAYSYTIQYRRSDGSAAVWTNGQTEWPPPATGNVILTASGLKAETAYQVRMVITDEERGTSTNDTKVLTVNVTTDCQKPGKISTPTATDVTSTSASIIIERLSNAEEACAYELQWTLSPVSAEVSRGSVRPGGGIRETVWLNGLVPFTSYTLVAVAENRKGTSSTSSVTFQTNEAPPSQVLDLEVKPDVSNHVATWKEPKWPNGRIRQYTVILTHLQYKACPEQSKKAVDEEFTQNVTGTTAQLPARVPFSRYVVTVSAVTIAPGRSLDVRFESSPQAPSKGPSGVRAVNADETSVNVRWSFPDCTAWNDYYANIRVNVLVLGASAWNMNTRYDKVGKTSQTEIEIIELTPYSNYFAQVSMNNSVGVSPDPQTTRFSTRQSSYGPDRPANFTVLTVTSTSLTVGWDRPSPPLCRITEYRVECRGDGCPALLTVPADGPGCRTAHLGRQCGATVTGLKEVTSYTLEVAAFCEDVRKQGSPSSVNGTTQEGRPGPPGDVRQQGLQLTELHVRWTTPVQRNGRILRYQVNVSESEDGPPLQSHVIKIGRDDEQARHHSLLVEGLEAGHRYLVRVAASTAVGQGNSTAAWLETRVPPPQLPASPEVQHDLVTDSTVQLRLPSAAGAGGPPVSRYYVIVSENLDLDGAAVEAYPANDLPNAEEASRRGISFYVAAVADPEHVDTNGTFVIGDGKYYNTSEKSYYNQPLKTDHTYRIGMAALSRLSDDNMGLSFRAVDEPITVRAPNATGTILGSLFGIMLILLIVIGALAFRRRILAQKAATPNIQADGSPATPAQVPMEELYTNPAEGSAEEESTYENLTSLFLNKSRVRLSELVAVARNTDLLQSQFSSLPLGLTQPCLYGRKPQNRAKNRYGNLMPYDNSRVKLEKLEMDECSDYINANYVDGYERPGAYIATQGPKPETIFDFWRMLWEKKVARVVMLTNLVEGDKKKCDLYWPEDRPLLLLNLKVEKESSRMSNDYTVRTFVMVRGRERRTVTQLHYTAWPDHSVPLYPSSLARFIRELDAVPDGEGPTVVHCSAGVGRTGTVILIDALHKMGRCEQAVDVYRQLTVVRQQRANLCASLAQYQLVHQVLVELLVSPSAAVPAAQLAVRLPQLKSVADGPSQLEQQLSFLASNPPPASYASARAENLEGKNRSPEILPEDKSRVFLHSCGLRDNYVNAVFVQGFKKPDAFIATEAPLPKRRHVFWNMVVEKQSQTVVVMNDLEPDDVFWPTTEEPITFGTVVIQLRSRVVEPVETLDLTLNVYVNGKMETSQEVRLFLLPFGDPAGSLPSAEQLVVLHSAYERSLPHSYGGVTTVVCRSGVTGCGLFIASSFVMDQLAEEQEIDVVMAVSTVRKSRPQFIGTLKQFELCYDAALAWLKAFDIYSNFQ
ncbi:receptor-type tyrosine-protein phosphatase mu-like [Amphibalanus amphitrite]|uniref:receptor-type tyrosine-protein phosphatase mu-like n=1 Tax=Amphibalanus amphitrite TaxID=1232801 RepID=UPI001C90E743|nr:receptor-type tyrosine-protein phosphatase mu-like [Amphibalanus amphitrite]